MATVLQKKIEAVEALLKLGRAYGLKTMETELGTFEFTPEYVGIEVSASAQRIDPDDDPLFDQVRRR